VSVGREIAIVGAGPVGLLLALRALEEGLRPLVIERRAGSREGSRSIGVHPPSLEILGQLGLAERFVARGVRVRRGLAFGGSGALGAVDFDGLPGEHRFVLTIAQADTESILRDALEERAPGSIREGLELSAIGVRSRDGAKGPNETVDVSIRDARGETSHLSVAAVIGCDGKHSATRSASGLGWLGGPYPGRYAMLDVPDTTQFGDDAAVFLSPRGLVESFPLPGRKRRWVIRRDADRDVESDRDATVDEIAATVRARTGHRLASSEAGPPSSFRAERYLAGELASGPVALAGDAGHVISPIGGQGMNLGWLGASQLATALGSALRSGRDPAPALARDAVRRRRAANAAARRAELNMWLGRPIAGGTCELGRGVVHDRASLGAHSEPSSDARAVFDPADRSTSLRDEIVRALLGPPSATLLARVFTMRGLSLGI
jgi:2-polyprenyl-6-methoxyphenol hydroxylase-like FAD-dependent oxidoreductase